MLYTFIYFLLALIIGGTTITGLFAVTRGKWVTNPDTSLAWEGQLLSFWLRFWTAEKGFYKKFFFGRELKRLMLKVESVFELSMLDYSYCEHGSCVKMRTENAHLLKTEFHRFQEKYPDIEVVVKDEYTDAHVKWVFFYLKKTEYRFSAEARKPLATCIYCFSSVYGSALWSLFAIVSRLEGSGLTRTSYGLLWLPYIISLSFISPYLWKKIKE